MKEEVVGEDMNEWRKIQLQVEKALCDYGAIRQTQIKKYRERTASIIQLKQDEVRQLFMKLGQRQSNSMKKRTLRLDKGFVTT
jgi:hypothetical protein